ncbi:putative uncharacterized protein [Firmicutes bacterium CAG:534]|nr:putative uncharacterized protein [Firmicutes bacterium CAG:534]
MNEQGNRERTEQKLSELMRLSKEPYFSRYVAQMKKDLEEGVATPLQVEREADRSYAEYQRRMRDREAAQPELKTKSVEFKIGIHVFSLIGALFILAAFVTFGFYFLKGAFQGICIYMAAFALVLFSELFLRRKMQKFAGVITGIGIGCLYAANIVNYLVLHLVNGIIAVLLTLLIAAATIWLSRKRDSVVIRLIGLIGCYVCLYPIHGFETELSFFVLTVILFIVNVAGVLFPNQSRAAAILAVHAALNVIFTGALLIIAGLDHVQATYLAALLLSSFIFMEIMAFVNRKREKDNEIFIITCIGSGLLLFMMFLLETITGEQLVGLIMAAVTVAVSMLFFLLWEKEDERKWAQVYFAAGLFLLIGAFSDQPVEQTITVGVIFLIARIGNRQRQLTALEAIAAVAVGLTGIGLSGSVYAYILAALLVLLSFRINKLYVFHEIVTTASVLVIWFLKCEWFRLYNWGMDGKWFYPVAVLLLMLLFLLFHHLQGLRDKKQEVYNIVSLCFIGIFCLLPLFEGHLWTRIAIMAAGTLAAFLLLRKRYGLYWKGNTLLWAGFFSLYSITGNFGSPVVSSILIMAVAFFLVGIGFRHKEKMERITGLVLAALVCLKLVLYDFREAELLYRMIVFLIVGVMALGISFLYMFLEKKMAQKKAEVKE